ncbi:cytochrome c oxidase assembly protein [Microbacterium sp. 179-B 1A2 NHS]|uniref:cytochrome c oxidase assembly protein n=1 Tax=Microbacterium sp. 179-B 1A2 NHS TaxID=3142383 RepID=UPI0039A3C501
MPAHASDSGWLLTVALAAPVAIAGAAYLAAPAHERRGGRGWPVRRVVCAMLGIAAAASGFVGPLADAMHDSFTAHLGAHVLVGMAAPLLLVQAAPITLALRTLSVTPARRVARAMRSRPARVLTHPVPAALLNVGGLWLLHGTGLFAALSGIPLGHAVMMLHFLLAGYLFTASIAPADPAPHRAPLRTRAIVLVAAVAAHGILAKLLYSAPPTGVATADARTGSQLMFYGGDAVDVVLIVLICAEWYRVTGRRPAPRAAPAARRQPTLGGAA